MENICKLQYWMVQQEKMFGTRFLNSFFWEMRTVADSKKVVPLSIAISPWVVKPYTIQRDTLKQHKSNQQQNSRSGDS